MSRSSYKVPTSWRVGSSLLGQGRKYALYAAEYSLHTAGLTVTDDNNNGESHVTDCINHIDTKPHYVHIFD